MFWFCSEQILGMVVQNTRYPQKFIGNQFQKKLLLLVSIDGTQKGAHVLKSG